MHVVNHASQKRRHSCSSDRLLEWTMRLLVATTLLLSWLPPAGAWGLTGHRVTGAIAERYLSFEARAAVRKILGGSEGLAEASTWPDFMRSSDEPFWHETASPYHFVTVPIGKTYSE